MISPGPRVVSFGALFVVWIASGAITWRPTPAAPSKNAAHRGLSKPPVEGQAPPLGAEQNQAPRLRSGPASGGVKPRIGRGHDGRRAPILDDTAADNGPSGGQAETSIAVDSTGQHIVVGINDTRGFDLNPVSVSGFTYSDDGGQTWIDGGPLPITVPKQNIGGTLYPQVYGDPEVKYAGGTTFLYFSIIVRKFSGNKTVQTMGVHRSTDNGHTWQGPYEIPPATNPHGAVDLFGNPRDAADKEFADVDPDTGRVMMTWSNFSPVAPGGVEISSTYSDNITSATPPTWSARRILGATATDGQASIPRFAGNGSPNVYVAWRRFDAGQENIGFARSTNNGVSFSGPVNLAGNFIGMDQVLGNDRVNSSPSLAVDNSSGPFGGDVYAVYSNNNLLDGADIVIQKSTDGGVSFSAPVRINSRPGADRAQWFPWVTVDNSSGRVYVFYYDQGTGIDGDVTETTYLYSDDGGATWKRPAPLTDRPFHAGYGNDPGQPNIGDYNQAVAQNGALFVVWSGNPPLVGFDDGQPLSAAMTVPDVFFKRVPAASTRLAVDLGIVSFSDGGPGALGGNGVIDPDEQIALTIPLRNYATNALVAGSITAVNATLATTTPGVLVQQGSSSYPDLAAGATGVNAAALVIEIGPSFQPGPRIELTLTVSSAQESTTLPFSLATGTPLITELLSQDFNGVAPGALPAGWSSVHGGGANVVPWTTSNLPPGTAPAGSNAAFHTNNAGNGLGWERLLGPQIVIPANSEYVTVEFDIATDTEEEPGFTVQAYDGVLLRITDHTPNRTLRSVAVEAFAEEFTTGSANFYPKHLVRLDDPNYFDDMSAWAGDSGGYRHVRLKLGGMAGSTAQLRFEYTQDSIFDCTNIRPGHRCGVAIDNVKVRSIRSVTPTVLTLTSSANPSLVNQSVMFTATVTTTAGAFATDGSVTFKEGSTVLSGPTPLTGGQASFTTSSLSAGFHTITAEYASSSGLFSTSTGSVVQQVVVETTVTLSTSSVTFGKQWVGKVSVPQTVQFTNTGTGALVFFSFNGSPPAPTFTIAPGDFQGSTDCPLTPSGLPPGQSCNFSFRFSPTAAGVRMATFSIADNATGSPQVINLSGTGFVVDEATVVQTVTTGGARVRALQNPDGGWFFAVGGPGCGGVSCPNTAGVAGLGLLATYARTNDANMLTGARAAGDLLVARYNAAPTELPYSQDIEFLVALAEITGTASYATTAQTWFQVAVTQFPNAADRIDALIAKRNSQGLRSLAAWDTASFVRAAKAVGSAAYALAAATRIRDREADWKDTNPSHRWDQCPNPKGCGPADNPLAFDYTILGEGSLLWAFHDLPGFDTQITEYRSFLLAQQDPDGSWDVGDTQITSYVVMGLAAVGGAGTSAAIDAAAAFFIANQLGSGGWPSYVGSGAPGGEYTVVDAEAVRAVNTLFNTPQGESVSVVPAQLSTVTFTTVNSSGVTNVVAQQTAATLPAGFEVVGDLTYQVTTTATVSGAITVCFSVPWIDERARFANVRILHGENGVLVDRTILSPGQPAPDFATRRVCSLVSSLSAFAIALRDTTPPLLSVELTPSALWPPNHRMVTVSAAIGISDGTDRAPAVSLVSITSNEPDHGLGQDDKEGDIQDAAIGTDDRTFQLRAERSPRSRGRVYTVVYRTTDSSGNTRDVTAQVVVPHNR